MSRKLTDEERKARDAYRLVYKREHGRKQYWKRKEEGIQIIKATPRFREERANGEVHYCDCGCGKLLDDSRYTEHYATRYCYIHTFHKEYCTEPVELAVYEG
jgi:hypothetical protein